MSYINKIAMLVWLVVSMLTSNSGAVTNNTIDIICDEWPPYQMIEGDQIRGFSTRVLEIVFKRMNVNINSIQAYPWKRAVMMIELGEVDALFSVNYTQERAHFAHYPQEAIVNSPWVMWTEEGSGLEFDSFDDLVGKSVGVVRGYSYTSDFWDFVKTHSRYEEVVTDEQNFKKLHAGRLDYIIAEFGNGSHIAKELGLTKVIPFKQYPVKIDGLFIIFNKKNVEKSFVERFSNELKKLKREALYLNIYEEYFNS